MRQTLDRDSAPEPGMSANCPGTHRSPGAASAITVRCPYQGRIRSLQTTYADHGQMRSLPEGPLMKELPPNAMKLTVTT